MAQSRPLILLVLSGLAAYLVLLTFQWNIGLGAPAFLAPADLRQNPKISMQRATSEFLRNRGDAQAIDLKALKSQSFSAPLEDEPFTFAAAQQFEATHYEEVEEILQVAVRRNPRSRIARIYLLELLVEQGRATEAVAQIEVLTRLMPERRGLFQSNLIYLASVPETRQEALAALSNNGLRSALLTGMARAGASPSMIIDSYSALEDFDFGHDRSGLVNSWVQPFIDRANYVGAKRVWMHFNPEVAPEQILIDADFTGDFDPPFGWRLWSGRDGYARFEENRLFGEHYGRRKMSVAQQLILLDAGKYTIEFADHSGVDSMELSIACSNGETLFRERLTDARVWNFEIPGDQCPAQTLTISARPTEPVRATKFEIGSVSLRKAAQ